jgi:hypothetical protein
MPQLEAGVSDVLGQLADASTMSLDQCVSDVAGLDLAARGVEQIEA